MNMIYIHGWFIFIILSIKCTYSAGVIFPVSNYGAYPNDNIDDSNAIQLTIDAAVSYGLNSTVIFGAGIYNLSSTVTIRNATNLTVTGQGMDKTFLVGNAPIQILLVQYCQGTTISSLSIDFDPLPFTAGYVVNVNDTFIDVQVKPPHRANIGQQVDAIMRYDPTQMRPAFGPNTYEFYRAKPVTVNTSLVSPGIVRLPITAPSEFMVGDPVVAFYIRLNHAIYVLDVVDFTMDFITVFTSWSMGLVTLRAKRLTVMNFNVLRRDERWASTIADCMHFADAREYVNIFDSKCEAMGDDGLNIHATYFNVTEIVNSSALVIQAGGSGDKLHVGVGTRLEFSTYQQPFTTYTTAVVISYEMINQTSALFIFDSPVNVSIGDLTCVADTPRLTIRNFTVANNRARGVLLETSNIDMRQSLFNRTSGPAVYFQPSLVWHEGPPARNASLTENVYINCNEGIAQHAGFIIVLPVPTQLIPVVHEVNITASSFYFGEYSQGLIQSFNAENVFISGNYIATNASTPLISLCNSRNVSARNNTVVNSQFKIDQYYSLNGTYPCQLNLTNLIDLPPSAFNSSFPPPVMITDAFLIQNQAHVLYTNFNNSTL
jgi:hypothetical protein